MISRDKHGEEFNEGGERKVTKGRKLLRFQLGPGGWWCLLPKSVTGRRVRTFLFPHN